MVKAYPWCFGDFDPCDYTCSQCPYRNVCLDRTDLVEHVKRIRMHKPSIKLPFHQVSSSTWRVTWRLRLE